MISDFRIHRRFSAKGSGIPDDVTGQRRERRECSRKVYQGTSSVADFEPGPPYAVTQLRRRRNLWECCQATFYGTIAPFENTPPAAVRGHAKPCLMKVATPRVTSARAKQVRSLGGLVRPKERDAAAGHYRTQHQHPGHFVPVRSVRKPIPYGPAKPPMICHRDQISLGVRWRMRNKPEVDSCRQALAPIDLVLVRK
jgi:hypothetical protein